MITLQFARSSLLYDIANYAYIEAHRLDIDEDAPLRAHLLSDITAPGNVDRVNRVIAVVFSAIRQRLRHFMPHDIPDAVITDEIVDPDVYEISICVPRWLDVDLLSRLIHEYMVYRVMHDWLSLTHPQYGAPWQEKADDAFAAIGSILNPALRPSIRRSHIF